MDTRELQQSGGIEDRDFLRSLLHQHNNQVMVNAITKDRYGRTVAELFLPNGELVQEIQARKGKAFPFPRYKQDCPSWTKVESAGAAARKKKLGVWASNNPDYPWEFRKNNR